MRKILIIASTDEQAEEIKNVFLNKYRSRLLGVRLPETPEFQFVTDKAEAEILLGHSCALLIIPTMQAIKQIGLDKFSAVKDKLRILPAIPKGNALGWSRAIMDLTDKDPFFMLF